MSPPRKISDYTVLPLTLPATRLVPAAPHYIYLRSHAPKLPTADDSRSLFVVNVPIDATPAHFRVLFSGIGGGRVENVVFDGDAARANVGGKRKRDDTDTDADEMRSWDRDLRRSAGTAVAVFVDKASRDIALKAAAKAVRKKLYPVWGEGVSAGVDIPALGVSRYLAHHNHTYPSKSRLQASVDSFMAGFEADEAARMRALARRRQKPDEDGFIAVVRGGRVAPAKQEEAKAVLEKKKRKDKHEGFYRFQVREERKSRQMALLAKFEEDKRKVAERKDRRRFKPL